MFVLRRNSHFGIKNTSFSSKIRTLIAEKSSENIVRCPSSDVRIPHITISELIYSKMEPFHQYDASECAVTGKKYTFEQVRVKSKNLSKALKKRLTLHRGDVVAIFIPNRPEYLVACLGILEAGLVITTLSPNYTQGEISKQLKDSSAKTIITTTELFETAKAASLAIKQQMPIISMKNKDGESLPRGAINFEEMINTITDIPDIDPGNTNDLAFMPYSSGTTGLPKGVELTHSNLISVNAQALHPDYQLFEPPTRNFQDVVPAVIPFFHIYGFTVLQLNAAVNGTKLITVPRFQPDSFISVLKNHGITALYAAPTLAMFLAHHDGIKTEYFDRLKFFMSGGAPLGYSDEKRVQEKIGKNKLIFQGYGMTESAGLITTCASKKLMETSNDFRGSVGQPVPNTLVKVVRVGDNSGVPLGPNERGEIMAKGPQVMKGYHDKPKETQETFLDDWLITGDIGYFNEDNMIFITDRLKELIKVKGYQVAPAELEEVIRNFHSVEDVAVVGVPHPVLGEAPKAYVVPKNKGTFVPEEVEHFVAARLTKYKHLKGGVEVVDSIPRNPSGKILRRLMKKH